MNANHADIRWPIYASVAAAIVTIAMKSAAYWYTGSVGLFSDAAESGVNLIASVTAMVSMWYAARPVDAEHTYGHEKIVYFSSGLEGLLIFVAAIGTASFAVLRLFRPVPLEKVDLGSAIALAAAAINFMVARRLLAVGRTHSLIVLEADGHHLMTDVYTSVGVVLGLALARATGIQAIDPIVAILVSANILWTGWTLIRRSFDGLMDRALPADEQAVVRTAIERNIDAKMAFHALRTRQAGQGRFVDFHLLVPGSMTVHQAHAQADRIEAAIRAALPAAEISIHIEPIEEPGSWQDSALIAVEEKTQ